MFELKSLYMTSLLCMLLSVYHNSHILLYVAAILTGIAFVFIGGKPSGKMATYLGIGHVFTALFLNLKHLFMLYHLKGLLVGIHIAILLILITCLNVVFTNMGKVKQ